MIPKQLFILLIVLIAAIFLVFIIKTNKEMQAKKLAMQQQQADAALLAAALEYKAGVSGSQTKAKDWLNGIAGVSNAVASIFSGVNLGLGGGK
jgi:hypothetical protein